jgi:cysteinyl-tRNA synthetase
MSISIYNTLTSQKEPFQPLEPQQVSMYCCGVTVYDLCHVGHARSYVIWDTVRRYLEWRGYSVKYIQNFTDIDDKILHRAREQQSSMEAISGEYIAAYLADLARLNVKPATSYPRATEHISQIIELIGELETKGLAYAAAGDVYYRVSKFPGYGKLSGRKLEDMLAGASGRVEDSAEQQKENPGDFALWKSAKAGEPAWDSPWGQGRPGWHIECSAMIDAAFEGSIDIHCGGSDLIFPHHENEIAQSEGAHDHPLAKYWLHNGMVVVDGVKMSKSLGNFTTIRDLLDKTPNPVDPMVIRLFILTAQYRKPLDFTKAALESNATSWQTLKTGLMFGSQFGEKLGWDLNAATPAAPPLPSGSPAVPAIDLPLAPFVTLPDNARKFSHEYHGLIVLAVILFFTQFPIRFLARFISTFNTVPVLPEFFKLVGVAIFARTILFKAPREKFFAAVRGVFSAVFKDRSAPAKAPVASGVINSVALNPEPEVSTASNESVSFQKFCTAVNEDFNFAGGLAVLFELAKSLGKQANILNHGGELTVDSGVLHQQWQELCVLASVLGLDAETTPAGISESSDQLANPAVDHLTDEQVEALVDQRNQARQAKNFSEADRIRKELEAKGIELIDTSKGSTTWRYQ